MSSFLWSQTRLLAGNHAFARRYNELVPDTWHVINDRDAVPRIGKFFFLFKRPGHRVGSLQRTLDLRRPVACNYAVHPRDLNQVWY